jgi:hypothetical protein
MAHRFDPLALVGLLVVLVVAASCSAPAPTPSPASNAPSGPSTTPPSAAPSEAPTPAATAGNGLAGVPIACYGLGQVDCQRVAEQAVTLVGATGQRVIYLQIGPFGCTDSQRCPTTLPARPEGDITIELAGTPALGFHVKAAAGGGALDIAPAEIFGIALEPTTPRVVLAGAQPFSLGHCGLWSGIDLGGSWWDPVGPIDYDHGDAINAAEGTVAFTDADHATFTSKGGLTVQLQRRDGGKHFPFCD